MIENTSFLHQSEISKINYSIDINDCENDTEDKKEISENEKIHQSFLNIDFNHTSTDNKNYFFAVKNYTDLHFEFTTPPPELI